MRIVLEVEQSIEVLGEVIAIRVTCLTSLTAWM